ncbi:hypothetical protein B0O99DRAFT_530406, partial [Bisporella sp. PMI_857]
KKSGRRPLLGLAERKQLAEWVCASAENRRTPGILGWNCAAYAIETALRKPALTAEKQWAQILWTDKTWVQPGKHGKFNVKRRVGKVLHPDCLDSKVFLNAE